MVVLIYLCGLDDRQVVDEREASTHGCPQTGGSKRHPGAEPPPQLLAAPLLQQHLHLPAGLRVLENTASIREPQAILQLERARSTSDRQYCHSSSV